MYILFKSFFANILSMEATNIRKCVQKLSMRAKFLRGSWKFGYFVSVGSTERCSSKCWCEKTLSMVTNLFNTNLGISRTLQVLWQQISARKHCSSINSDTRRNNRRKYVYYGIKIVEKIGILWCQNIASSVIKSTQCCLNQIFYQYIYHLSSYLW